ncbi:cupin domain-containing protein [Pseudoalteromonas luteoviolacea]|uniref:cupin domain-containing protein n=1 Tax=Pseudoalteromonas luteoviolacea TaxID=43657 RepID=UPI001B3A4620|nr:cupin domain-containing protein [Pseudoalteromonas luteoviolacea]MBQ4877948.1 cupin domain-containing protein [Pseudoalteromonas luteoviolacea]MBQ4906983.1 cupin domain-containing protein [Pseudoalteromonas luteoviolacea]
MTTHNAIFVLFCGGEITLTNEDYAPSSLQSEGYIHACTATQVEVVYQRFYANLDSVKVAVIDPRRVNAKLVFEAPSEPMDAHTGFPHIYGKLNLDAVVDIVDYQLFTHQEITPDILDVLAHYRFDRLPVEGTLYKSTWRADNELGDSTPVGTAMIGMYCSALKSVSCFHRLTHDEVWHFYQGDAFNLYLLYPDGTSQTIVMGTDFSKGQQIQCRIPAGVWQAGELAPGGQYALFGCTMAPGFTGDCFEAADHDALKQSYPEMAAVCNRLAINNHETKMPAGFAS